MQLRDYQRRAVDAVYDHIRKRDDNPVVVMPTGSGKSWVIAQIAHDVAKRWGGRCIVLAHVKELLQQNAEKIQHLVGDDVTVGIYSAGLGQKDADAPIVVAGIQSIYKKATEVGRFDVAIVDEAHLIPNHMEGIGRYQLFLKEAKIVNPNLRVIGLTATPYRMDSGMICSPAGILNHVCYEVGVRQLIRDGYLCPLVTKRAVGTLDTSGVKVQAGDFKVGDLDRLGATDSIAAAAVTEIVEYTQTRHSVLVFTCGINHANIVAEYLRELTDLEVATIFGDTPSSERAEIVERFRNGDLKYVVNVNVLTTGFDAPNIDCVAILRPTLSPGLWYQMVGRGLRKHETKQDCLVLDFGDNAIRHGPIDDIRPPKTPGKGGPAPTKECPACHEVIHAGCTTCPVCDHNFPINPNTHNPEAADFGVLSGEVAYEWVEVQDILYMPHKKRDAPENHPKTLRVEYRVGLLEKYNEWVCLEHSGFPRARAVEWWLKRGGETPVPATVEQAMSKVYDLKVPRHIKIRRVAGEKYPTIVDYDFGTETESIPREDFSEDLSLPF